jgi:hypothetical protein
LSEHSMTLDELVKQSGMDPVQLARVAEWLVDQGRLIRKKDLTLSWKT